MEPVKCSGRPSTRNVLSSDASGRIQNASVVPSSLSLSFSAPADSAQSLEIATPLSSTTEICSATKCVPPVVSSPSTLLRSPTIKEGPPAASSGMTAAAAACVTNDTVTAGAAANAPSSWSPAGICSRYGIPTAKSFPVSLVSTSLLLL